MKEIYKTKEGFEALVNTFESMTDDFSLIVLSAFRYALGRRTYIVSVVCNYVKANIGMLQKYHLPLLVEEIEDAENFNMLGDPCDRKEWLQLKEYINAYLNRIKSNDFVDTMSTKLEEKGEHND